MKLALPLAIIPFAANAALNVPHSNGWLGARRGGLALVMKSKGNGDFTLATRDGGEGSASFRGEVPKGGSLLKDVFGYLKDATSDVGSMFKKKEAESDSKSSPKADGSGIGTPFDFAAFLEGHSFKEGSLGFIFGAGTAVCVRKVNKNAASVVGATFVAAQYLSRSDLLGFGGKLGWPMLDESKLGESDRENFPCCWRAARLFKDTVAQSLPAVGGYALGLAAGLKAPLP